MANEIEIGKSYYKDGQEVVVCKLCTIVNNHKFADGVLYEYSGKDPFRPHLEVEKKSDFITSTIPTTLRNGDRIVATCMGKILSTYKVDGHGYEIANAISEDGGKMQFFVKIKPNGFVEPKVNVSNMPQETEYLFVSSGLEKKLAVSKLINSCLSKIGNIQKTLSSDKLDYDKIDVMEFQDLTVSLDKVKKEIDKTLKFLNNE